MFTFFLFLGYDGVGVAHGDVEAGELLRLFYRVNLSVVGALPSASCCYVLAGVLYADCCCFVGPLWCG